MLWHTDKIHIDFDVVFGCVSWCCCLDWCCEYIKGLLDDKNVTIIENMIYQIDQKRTSLLDKTSKKEIVEKVKTKTSFKSFK